MLFAIRLAPAALVLCIFACGDDGGEGAGQSDGSVPSVDADPNSPDAGPRSAFGDSFEGTGPLVGYTTNSPGALPDVTQAGGRYRANLTDNTDNITLHFNGDQGRLDAREIAFPFDVVARNIGIGTQSDSQVAPLPTDDPFIFAGIQVHVTDLESRNSSHVVVGHRGDRHFTVEGKNTTNGSSNVNDVGVDQVPDGRADIRIVGNADRSLTVYWQVPNLSPGSAADSWNLYGTDGSLPGLTPAYGPTVYVGLITYAFYTTGVPFVGTCDAIHEL